MKAPIYATEDDIGRLEKRVARLEDKAALERRIEVLEKDKDELLTVNCRLGDRLRRIREILDHK